MNVQALSEQLQNYHDRGLKIFVTSSFQTHSIPLLHAISQQPVPVDVYFLNTGFHFPETVTFKDQIAELLNLNVKDVRSFVPKIEQRDSEGNFHFISDPDYCCYLNKVQPLEPILQRYDVWISGVRGDQSATRKGFKTEEQTPDGTLRYHPMLGVSAKDIFEYRKAHNLPEHPLEAKGYLSIGCAPCTQKIDLNSRGGRWFGMQKTECGLHKDLVK